MGCLHNMIHWALFLRLKYADGFNDLMTGISNIQDLAWSFQSHLPWNVANCYSIRASEFMSGGGCTFQVLILSFICVCFIFYFFPTISCLWKLCRSVFLEKMDCCSPGLCTSHPHYTFSLFPPGHLAYSSRWNWSPGKFCITYEPIYRALAGGALSP